MYKPFAVACLLVCLSLLSAESRVLPDPGDGDESVLTHVKRLGGTATKLPAPFKKVQELWSIDLSGTKAADNDLAKLAKLPHRENIAHLNLSDTGVTDAGLAHLKALPELQRLDLTGTRVTDKSVKALSQLRKIYLLSVARTGFTNKGTDELLRQFPSLQLCRTASGKKSEFRVIENYRDRDLEQKQLMLGDTLFAIEFVNKPGEARRGRLATTYYHRHGPVGQILAGTDWLNDRENPKEYPTDARLPASLVGLCAGASSLPTSALTGLWSEPAVGVIRLNAGTHASYGRPFQFVDFYDNTPAIQAFSYPPKGQPREFDFVHDALARGCTVRLFNGDERPTLAKKGPRHFYQALFVEITRESLRDVNTALMTKEGVQALMQSIAPNGVLCYHISHRYNDFKLPLADAADSLGYSCRVAHDTSEGGAQGEAHFTSEWFIIARKAADLPPAGRMGTVTWSVPMATGQHLWRDGQQHDLKALEFKRN